MNEKRDFKGVWIPKRIWLHPGLKLIEKCLLVEIDSLDNDERGCFASNEYFADFFDKKPGTIANIISRLRKRGFIEDTFWDGRNRGIRVSKNESSLHEKMKADTIKNRKQPSRKNESSLHEKINIIIQENNTVNNTIDKEEIRDSSRIFPDDIADKIAEKGISEDLLNDAVEKALAIIANKKNTTPQVAAAPSIDFPECDEDLKEEYEFQDFWNEYDYKTDKAKCQKKWKRLNRKEKLEIKRTLPWYKSDTVKNDSEQKGSWRPRRKNPLTYLNGQTWLDYEDLTGPKINEARIRDIKRTNATQIIDSSKYDKWRKSAQTT